MSAKKQASLFSFFQSKGGPPKQTSTPLSTPKTPKPDRVPKRTTEQQAVDDYDENSCSPVKVSSSVKRRRVIVSSDEEDDHEMMKEKEVKTPSAAATPKTARRPLAPSKTPATPRTGKISTQMAESFISSFRAGNDDDMDTTAASVATLDQTMYKVDNLDETAKMKEEERALADEGVRYEHEDMEFLWPEKIRDAQRRRPDHPQYDPTTLYLSHKFLEARTPGHKQWWQLKAANFDTILLFKVGKFYELYHMDAVVSVEHLSLSYMSGAYAHTGFPESAYGRFADQLVSRGFKVARVEQTETPQQLAERVRKQTSGKKDKVVRRELCAVTTTGTRTYGVLDGSDQSSGLDGVTASAHYLVAIKETSVSDERSVYGVCLIDTSVGRFLFSQFEDDQFSSRLRTLLANRAPAQVVLERGGVSRRTRCIVDCMCSSVPREALPPTLFLSADEAVKKLCADSLLGADSSEWPGCLRDMLEKTSSVPRPHHTHLEAWSAIGAVLGYLSRCLIEVEMVTMRAFTRFDPLEMGERVQGGKEGWKGRRLVLDGVTLENLNLLPSEDAGVRCRDARAAAFSLYNTLNKCATPFGKRLLREWICAPTCDSDELKLRQDAVEWLLSPDAAVFSGKAIECLRAIPDLDRMLQKMHTLGLKYRAVSHPDSRAVMFEGEKYSKRKMKDLLATLGGFKQCRQLIAHYQKVKGDGEGCELLDELLSLDDGDFSADLDHFDNAFDHAVALKDGRIEPKRKGADEEYDEACERVDKCEARIETYRKETAHKLACKIVFWGTGKNRLQMEIAEGTTLSNKFELKSKRKGFGRYHTRQLEELISELESAEQARTHALADVSRRIFADFDSRRELWCSVVSRVGRFDVLHSLARFAATSGLEMCRPVFDHDCETAVLDIEEGCHPCLATKFSEMRCEALDAASSTYIPNSSRLGGEAASLVLLTGPNMGGKSTLMRQVAVLTVLAHMGSFVPARAMRLSPVDRIFTRIGANDRILAGQSTFFVELHETRVLLRDSTRHSLVLVDELGRGTSTHDGTAIAAAVLTELADHVRCRCYFSTHYHSLCQRVAGSSRVSLAHMACVVENEDEAEDASEESVAFLYQLTDGICPKSYGFHAAKLAGIDKQVVRGAVCASSRVGAGRLAELRRLAHAGASVHSLRAMLAAM